jgi:uncharacterized Zn-binding protein involved in type VI secretion
MPQAATRQGDLCTGHPGAVSRHATSGSENVFIDGQPAHRVGDTWEPHGAPAHPDVLASGSETVFVNGQPLGRIGDSIDCGSVVAQGSPDVFCGD